MGKGEEKEKAASAGALPPVSELGIPGPEGRWAGCDARLTKADEGRLASPAQVLT